MPSSEPLQVAGVLLGRRHPVGWAVGGEAADFHDASSAVQGVLDALGIRGVDWVANGDTWLHPRTSARLMLAAESLGVVGELHPRVAQAFDLPRGVLAFELHLDALLRAARLVPQYRPIPHLPAVLRDVAVVVAEGVTAASVEAVIREEALVEDVTLFDVYRGAPLPSGKKNLALAIRYRAPDRTLTDAEADAAHGRILERLAKRVGAELRG
jgi:phenylalanyl-tRNA synthetase beta chain